MSFDTYISRELIFTRRVHMKVTKAELVVKQDLELEQTVAKELDKKDDDRRFFIEIDREDSGEGKQVFQISEL